MYFKRYAQSKLVSILSLTQYLLAAESVRSAGKWWHHHKNKTTANVRRCALCVLVWEILWSPRGNRNNIKTWKKKQCNLKKEPRRDEKFCLAGFCAKKEQNEMTDLLYFRYDIYTFVITARISFTCSRTFPQFAFQVRQVHVRYHSSCFRYDTHTYVITARVSGMTHTRTSSQLLLQVRHVHLCFHSLHFEYDVYTT